MNEYEQVCPEICFKLYYLSVREIIVREGSGGTSLFSEDKYTVAHHSYRYNGKNRCRKLCQRYEIFRILIRSTRSRYRRPGRCFASSKFSEFCASQKVQLHLIATGMSRANGQVERVMSILKNLLSVVESSQRSWQDALGEVQLALNCTISRATEASPLEMLIGKQARPLGLVPPCETEC
ncbi:uncharacterized protein LOC120458243 [Drosophila santomea]|uniref:uncharacterized protein LOC120458243 n=1 Tax=Drosophila santomea TaxID=129105 RepID=UPI0019538A6E|nr:uncharacterized protein LOC120458243 [Drosophila santomea]